MSGKRERGISYGPTVKLNMIDDDVCGGASNQGTGATLYGGLAGIEIEFTEPQVYSGTPGTLYAGVYKYVHLYSESAAGVRGQIAFWRDAGDFLVTATPQDGNHAGVFLNAVTPGHWCWIQVGGLASVLFAAATTKATPAIKDVVVVASGDDVADVEDDATSYTNLIYKRILGIAEAAPVAGAISLVELLDRFSSPDK
jgi:hypothetical protein